MSHNRRNFLKGAIALATSAIPGVAAASRAPVESSTTCSSIVSTAIGSTPSLDEVVECAACKASGHDPNDLIKAADDIVYSLLDLPEDQKGEELEKLKSECEVLHAIVVHKLEALWRQPCYRIGPCHNESADLRIEICGANALQKLSDTFDQCDEKGKLREQFMKQLAERFTGRECRVESVLYGPYKSCLRATLSYITPNHNLKSAPVS